MTDPFDDPADDSLSAMELLYPFVCVTSKGGPYDDQTFVAGVQLGRIDQALDAAAHLGATELRFTVYTTLVKQLDLAGMARGWKMTAAEVEETPDYQAMPEWTFVTFTR